MNFGEHLKAFCKHPDEAMRSTAIYSLGKLKQKKDFMDTFIAGLEDPSPRVVHTTLQALAGVRDPRLLASYARVQERFKTEEHHVLANLKLRLKEMEAGFSPWTLLRTFARRWGGTRKRRETIQGD